MCNKQALIRSHPTPPAPPVAHSVRVWFYQPLSPSEPTVNRLVARADGPYCHCELQFSDDSACTIYMQSVVVLRRRRFSSANYTCLRVACTRAQEAECRRWAEAAVRLQVPFSVVRMVNAFCRVPFVSAPTALPTPQHDEEVKLLLATGTFCSEVCVKALQAGGVLDRAMTGAHTSPSALARALLALDASCEVPRLAPPACGGAGTSGASTAVAHGVLEFRSAQLPAPHSLEWK